MYSGLAARPVSSVRAIDATLTAVPAACQPHNWDLRRCDRLNEHYFVGRNLVHSTGIGRQRSEPRRLGPKSSDHL